MTGRNTYQRVGLGRAIQAERLRARGSSAQRFALAGLVISLIQGAGWWTVAARDPADWQGLFSWQTLYVTGLLAPMMALLATMVARREQIAREGGTWVRPVPHATSVAARMVILAGQSALFHVGLVLPLVLVGILKGLQQPPLGQMVAMIAVVWATALLPLSLAMLLTRWMGMVPVIGLALVWQIAGTLTAETPAWWAQPWSWPVHAAMPILQIHANGVRLEAASPVQSWNPVWPTLLCVVVAIFAAALQIRLGPVWARTRKPSRRLSAKAGTSRGMALPNTNVTVGRRHALWAQLIVLKSIGIYPLVVLTFAVLVITSAVWGSTAVMGLACWLLIPLGTAVLAVLCWRAHAEAWRGLAMRRDPRRLAFVMTLPGIGVLAAVAVFTQQLAGSADTTPRGLAWLLFLVGVANLLSSLWISRSMGPAVALGVTMILMIVSLVFGASTLSDGSGWVAGIYGWPLNATGPARTALISLLLLFVSVVAMAGWLRSARRAARD